jgi:hypothetical protein
LTSSGAFVTNPGVLRVLTVGVCALALVFPAGAAAQQTVLDGGIEGLQLPLRLNGVTVSHLAPGDYTFSLSDRSSQHSFHVRGPYNRPGVSDETTNFGTAGADGGNVIATALNPFVFEDVALVDGLYRWFCDRHSDMMTGSVMVGNYLAVKVEGFGFVTSDPAGLYCAADCGLGVPDGGGPVTLTASALAGSEFDHWSGGPCSGTGPCTVSVSGLVEVRAVFRKLPTPPPPPAETAPGTVKQVKVTAKRGKRIVAVTLDLTGSAAAAVQLRAGGKTVATVSSNLATGRRTVKIAVPKKTKAGPATVRVSLTRTGSAKTFVVNRAIRLPKL